MEWDLFVSHASEDKEDIVKPLVNELERYGLKVWYDEFELKIGDSLSESIDKGIIHSKNGLIIISKSFLNKNWTDYELKSFIMKETEQCGNILPIWHNVTKADVMNRSLFLADKFALSSDIGVEQLAIKILQKIRPDILSSYALKHAFRNAYEEERSEIKKIKIENLEDGKIVHKSLPNYILASSFLINQIFSDVWNSDYKDFIENLAKDWDYDREFFIWNVITSSYLMFIRNNKISFDDIKKKKDIFADLVGLSLGNTQPNRLDKEEYNVLMQIYMANYDYIKQFNLYHN